MFCQGFATFLACYYYYYYYYYYCEVLLAVCWAEYVYFSYMSCAVGNYLAEKLPFYTTYLYICRLLTND